MGKPNIEAFDEWFALEKEQPAIHLLGRFAEVPLGSANGSVVVKSFGKILEAALREAHDVYQLHLSKSKGSRVRQWADSQPGFLKAKLQLDKYAKHLEIDSWIRRFMEIVENENDPGKLRLLIERVFREDLSSTWSSPMYRALHEYYYTDNAARMYAIVQHGSKAIQAILRAIDRGQSYLDDIEELLHIRLIGLPQTVNRLREVSFAHLPIQRNTKFKSEHLFVSRIWMANREFVGRPKPDVIVELMTMDDFSHQFDERTVERICARLKDRAKRTARISLSDRKVAGAN